MSQIKAKTGQDATSVNVSGEMAIENKNAQKTSEGSRVDCTISMPKSVAYRPGREHMEVDWTCGRCGKSKVVRVPFPVGSVEDVCECGQLYRLEFTGRVDNTK